MQYTCQVKLRPKYMLCSWWNQGTININPGYHEQRPNRYTTAFQYQSIGLNLNTDMDIPSHLELALGLGPSLLNLKLPKKNCASNENKPNYVKGRRIL